MKRVLFMLLPVFLLLSACTAPTTAIAPAGGIDQFVLSAIGEDAQYRLSSESEFIQPQAGISLPVGAELITSGAEGAILDLGGGNALHLSSGSYITILAAPGSADAAAHISLLTGNLWAMLSGGSLAVETPVGTATASASYLSVAYDNYEQHLTAACLEGNCSLTNDGGETGLVSGQSASISGVDQPPTSAQAMTAQQASAWVQMFPENKAVAERMPASVQASALLTPYPTSTPIFNSSSGSTPEDYPDLEWFTYRLENNCTGGEGKYARTPWTWWFAYLPGDGRQGIWYIQFTVNPDEVRTGNLPAGTYLSWGDYTQEGSIRNADRNAYKIWEAGDDYGINVVLCPDSPRLP